jgi:tripartite-type tricarboxylate transporter receptor subunit TctC
LKNRLAAMAGLSLAAACAAGLPGHALAQAYPVKPIRLVIPFAPGGSSEIISRTVTSEMAKGMGQQWLIDARAGAAGNIAMEEVSRASPDGYTLILGHIGTMAVNPYMFEKLPFDTNRDFTPISLWIKVPQLYVVNSDVPARNLREFVKLVQSKPGGFSYGSAGIGSAGHLSGEYFKLVARLDMLHVPYKGSGPQLVDLVAGRNHFAALGTPPLMPHIRSGKLRAIAIGTTQRSQLLTDVPTVAEQGYPGFETSQWYGLMGPARLPEAVVKRLAEESARAMRAQSVRERFAADDALPVGSTPAEFSEFIRTEQARWSEVVLKAKIRPE